jgi:acetyl esterase/lipase
VEGPPIGGLSASDRLSSGVARLLVGLPAPAQRALAGRPVRIDGQLLDREAQLLLRLLKLSGQPELDELSVAEARARRARAARSFGGATIPVARVESIEILGPAGPIGARLYVPEGESAPDSVLVYYHGGGWVICDLDTHDNLCRLLASEAGVTVLSVDYRLAPEHEFPAAVEDALAAYRFAVENASELGANPESVAVGGDSAGGTLAAVTSQLTAGAAEQPPAFQLLFYPATDLSKKSRSYRLFSEGFFLTEADMDWFRGHYLPDEAAALDRRASPLLAGELAGQPPAWVMTAGFDPLRDEGEEYACRLGEAGVPVALRRHGGLIHGVVNVLGLGRAGRTTVAEAAGALRMGLAETGAPRRAAL